MTASRLVRGASVFGALPVPATTLVGRAAELDTVLDLVTTRRARLITMVGLGGVGKTGLAVEVAQRARHLFTDDAAFVDLAAVTDATTVPDELCRQLDVVSFLGEDSIKELDAALARRDQLLVIDNVEQVVDAGRYLAELVQTCPELVLLVTSRRRLRLAAEQIVPVPPLASHSDDASGSAPPAAVQLYVERGRAVDPAFAAEADATRHIAEICRLLDGLPLAIELAAARSRTLRPRQILDRLRADRAQPWSVLAPAPVDAPRRHSGVREAINWSLDLLEPAELALFRRLGAFSDSWSLEAAERICAGSTGAADRLDTPRVLDALETLVDLHLVEPVPAPDTDGARRFRLLETIAATARSLLCRYDEEHVLRQRHADYYLDFLLAADEGLEGPDEAMWFRRIDADTADVDAALRWLDAEGRSHELSRAVAALGPYWLNRGRFAAGRRWLSYVVERSTEPSADAVLACRGWSARLALDGQAGTLTASESAGLIAELESVCASTAGAAAPRRWLRAVDHLSYAHRLYGDPVRGRELAEQAVHHCETGDLAWWQAEHLLRLALLHEQLGDGSQSRLAARRATVAALNGGNERVRARALQAEMLGDPNLDRHELRTRLTDVLARSEEFGDRRGAVTTRLVLASLAAGEGELVAFGRSVLAAIEDSTQIGYQHGIGLAGITLAFQAGETGDWLGVAEVHAVIARQLPTLRRQVPSHFASQYDLLAERARQHVGAERLTELLALGADRSSGRSVEVTTARAQRFAALAMVAPAAPGAPVTSIHAFSARGAQVTAEPLSERQVQVLGLIAAGLTNQQIAEQLMLSPKTVMHHSSHIYRRLGVRGRTGAHTT